MQDVIKLEPATHLKQDGSYILSYPHLLSYFSERSVLTASDFVCGAHMVYGWMPTILDLYPAYPSRTLARGAELLQEAKDDGRLTDEEILELGSLVNNSLVGASKLLHFVRPDCFAIWDSKVCAFMFERKCGHAKTNQIRTYREYLSALASISHDQRFPTFHNAVNKKLGYEVSKLRAIELIMYLNSP